MSFLYTVSIFFFLLLCFLLCVTVLVQEGKGGGLGASFGGGEATDSLFGTATPDILKKVTAWLAIAFVAACILLSFWTSSLTRHHVALMPQEPTEITK